MNANGFYLPDEITLANIAEVRGAGERHITAGGNECTFHLAGLAQNNSLAVALLMAWFRHAHVHGKTIVYVDVPEQLRNIIDVYGLSEVLPIEQEVP